MTRTEDKRIYTFSREKPFKTVVRMSVPLIAGMFIMVMYNFVDTYFIGLTRDDYQLAAVSLAYPVMMVMIAISNMVGSGASSLIARCLGAQDEEKAVHTLTASWVLTLINSVTVATAGLVFLDRIVIGLGAKENTAVYTAQYIKILLFGTLATMGNYTFGQLLRSEGSVKYSMVGMVVGTLVNIILDPVFIFSLGMQIRGAAIATVLGNAAGFAVSLLFYFRGATLLKPAIRYIRPKADIVKEIFWVGIPASLETLLTSVAYVINNNLAVAYGELTVAAMGISQKLLSLGSYVYQGFASGTQPIMGYNYGAKNHPRMMSILKAGVLTVTFTELFIMTGYGVFAPYLVGIFSESQEVIEIGVRVLRTIMWILPFVGSVSMCRMSFQAMGKPQYAFGITFVRQLLLYVPLLLILNRLFSFYGMIWAQPITELIMMIISILLLSTIIRRESGDTCDEAEQSLL